MSPENILVVDDDPNILEVIRTRLGAAGYAVATAETADDALAKAAEEPFNLVITDLTNLALPFIRYANGDLAVPAQSGTCPCGRARTTPLTATTNSNFRSLARSSSSLPCAGSNITWVIP